MADLPDGFVAPTRDEWREMYLRRFKVRAPQLDASERSPVYLDASASADLLNVVGANCTRIALGLNLENADEATLTTEANARGIEARREATSSSGSVTVVASTGGGVLVGGDEIVDRNTGIRFRVVFSGTYTDGQSCAIVSVDTGPRANIAAGTVLYWTTQRPGIGPTATIEAQTDGKGTTGGRDRETVEEFRARILDTLRTPPAGSNEASYRKLLEGPALGFAIQKAFAYPCLLGPGTMGLAFTMRPAVPGGSRVPSASQLAKARAILPGDDFETVLEVIPSPVNVKLLVEWASPSVGWVDLNPWPVYSASYPYNVTFVTSATSFQITSTGNPSPVQPVAGQTIAIWDSATATFRRKRIGSFTGTNPWTITVDTTNSASDTAFVPPVGAPVSPWSPSLDAVGTVVGEFIDGLGPGEAVSWTATDEGQRQRRMPLASAEWPSTLGTRAFKAIDDMDEVLNWSVVSPSLPATTNVGTTSWVFVRELGTLAIYPL